MAFANKRQKSSTTELPASLREELGLGDGGQGGQGKLGGRQMGFQANARRGVIGRKDARKAERRDKKASKGRSVQQSQVYKRPQQQQQSSISNLHQTINEATRPARISNANIKGKGKETFQHRQKPTEIGFETSITAERGQRKHVGQGEATPLQRLMNRHDSSSRSEAEPSRKRQKRVPLSIVEQQEEDEIAWLEAHIDHKEAGSSKNSSKKKIKAQGDEEEESEGVAGGEDGLDDLLDDLDRFYPGMYDGADDSEEEEEGSKTSDLDESLEDQSDVESEGDSDEENLLSELEAASSSIGDEGGSPESNHTPSEIEGRSKVEEAPVTGRYVPPALRQKAAETISSDTAEMQKLRRQAKGLLNKLGEGNLESIVMEMMESLYNQYSRANVTEVLTSLVIQTVTSSSNLVDTFVILYAALVASLHRLVGLEFGAHFLQTIVESWQMFYNDAREKQIKDSEGVEEVGKEAKNLILLLANMYNLAVVASPLMFDIVKVILGIEEGKATRVMTEIDVELLLRIVKTSGSQLRHDDSTSLKTIVQLAQQSSELGALSSRSKFMLEALENVKNSRNKVSSNQGIEQQSIARMKKYLAGLSKRKTVRTQEPLRVGLQDLQDVDKRGKWWLVGAAWAGYDLNKKEASQSIKATNIQERKEGTANTGADEEAKRLALVQIARQHGMNTAIRQDIFIILISSQDYLDALEKLQSLKFKKESQRREVIRVLLHCIGSESNFNPYYVILASRLAIDDIGTKYTLQYCLWDFLRDLGEKGVGGRSIVERDEEVSEDEDSLSSGTMSEERITNVARAYGWWFAKGGLSLSAMKVIDFTTLKSRAIQFLQQLLVNVLLSAQTSSPTLTLRLCPSKERVDGPYPSHKKDINIDQSAKEAVEGIFVKGTLSNVMLCQGFLFFFERNLKPKDCLQIANSLGVTAHTTNQLLWARGVAKQVVKIGAHSSSNANNQ